MNRRDLLSARHGEGLVDELRDHALSKSSLVRVRVLNDRSFCSVFLKSSSKWLC